MLDKVKKFMELNNMIEDGQSVVVGVSGGADSMCLLSVLLELGIQVNVVHINHMLRGKAADEDMAYVENFCKKNNIKCYSFSYDVENKAKEMKVSCEEAGRLVRYETFYKVMKETESGKIAVAHNAGDSAETILHNLFRGTGIKGLCGIVPKRDVIIRPLLCVDREEIEGYLKERNIRFCNDATNFQDIYTRNKIRNTVLTYVRENINSNAANHITMAGQMLGEIDEFIAFEGDKLYGKCVVNDKNKFHILATEFNLLHIVMQKYIIRKAILSVTGSLKDITFNHIANVLELFSNRVGRSVNLPYNIVAKRTYDGVCVEKVSHDLGISYESKGKIIATIGNFGEFSIGENGEKLIVSPFSKDEWDAMENKYEENNYTKWLDCVILERNLVIRTRKTGDYIVVDDKGSKKKLKDFFINMKIPKEQRDKILLLADGDEILWVIGHRLNYNCRIKKDTKEIIKLEYKK